MSQPEELLWDDETLPLVVGALAKAGLNSDQIRKAMNEMQNAGIMFRERIDNNKRAQLIALGHEIDWA